nr:hypothetical protein [Acetobacter persici]
MEATLALLPLTGIGWNSLVKEKTFLLVPNIDLSHSENNPEKISYGHENNS